jgi:hypothetical protein
MLKKEGTVPVPRTAPALCDSAVITFSGVIASGGARVAGVKPPCPVALAGKPDTMAFSCTR